MKGLSAIDQIVISKIQLKKAFEFLRYAGTKRVEGVALFSGSAVENIFYIKEVIIPKQIGYILESGLMYAVESDELHRLNVWLYENNQQLMLQIHSHPKEAYHSETDDRYPIVDTYGCVSIVVPNFATGKLDVNDWAIYRLSLKKKWEKLDFNQVEKLFKLQ